MKAQQLKEYLKKNDNLYTGNLEFHFDEEDELTICWSEEYYDQNQSYRSWYDLEDIAEAIQEAEEEAPFTLSDDFAWGVLQILSLGDWLFH